MTAQNNQRALLLLQNQMASNGRARCEKNLLFLQMVPVGPIPDLLACQSRMWLPFRFKQHSGPIWRKLHDLEVEWCGGSDTMEGALARIHQREEAAVKRERTMAYAFSHQWRASTGHSLGLVNYELGKANWGWSWKERWIAARPWESRVPVKSASPNKMKNKQANKVDENTKLQTKKTPVSSKPSLSNGRAIPTARRLSYPPAEKQATLEGSLKSEAANAKREHMVS
ncbi:hypothetical protein OIU84_014276 [Salix udensis]|uniref:Uncharacterized protein n=1 Tax=Salix udensis TaxID=889485 RepID=A0AAD6JC47_9ROSI|nr:hypothetical protein OIU84_014276 [Salix udensis]